MRVGLFSDTYLPDLNGVATSVETLRKTLEEHGHDVFVIANHKGLLHLKREGNILRLPGIELKWLYGYNMSSPLQLKSKEEVKAMNLDIIHVHKEFGVGIFGRNVAKDLNIPIVSTYHTMYEDYTHYLNIFGLEIVDKATKTLVSALSKIWNDAAQVVIAPSQKTKDTLIRYGVKAPIHIIPTGIDLSQFNVNNIDPALVAKLKEKYGINKEDQVIVYVGRVANEKSIDIVIRGFKKYALADEHHKLMIVGGGPSLDELKELAKTEGIEKNVIFTDRQERKLIPAFYECAEAFVSCSTSETQGMTYIEAMSCSLPVFARKDEVLLNLIDEGKSGYFIDEDTFSDRLFDFFALSEEKRKEMGRYAREKVMGYDTEVFYERVAACYEQAYASYFKTLTIKKVKSNNEYVTLTLKDSQEEEIQCMVSLEDYFAFELKKDGVVHELTLQELQRREVILKAWILCIKKLAAKDRTRKEMYDILLKDNTLDAKTMNDMIDKLEEKGYINDQSYLMNHLEKMSDSLEGKQKIIRTLVKKGLPYEMVKEGVDSYSDASERTKAIRYIKKNEKLMKEGSVKMKKQMLISRLINHGYSFDIAKDVVNNYEFTDDFLNDTDSLYKAIQKAIRTYSRKYSGQDLKRMVLNQLIRKGFSSDDVLMAIEEMEIFKDEN